MSNAGRLQFGWCVKQRRQRAIDQVGAFEEHLFQFVAEFFEFFLDGHGQ
jgi:hypothetical protein